VLALLAYPFSAILYLCNGTRLQVVANPLGNAMAVAGTACVWAAASSLREWRPRWPWLAGPPLLVFLLSSLDDPAHDVWAGGVFFLAGMSGYFAVSTRELWRLWRERRVLERGDPAYAGTVLSMTAASAIMAVFYLLRTVGLVVLGPRDALFDAALGGQVTTLLLMVLLVVVTFSMSSLSQVERTRELQLAAHLDTLTGLLNRAGFQRFAAEFVRDARRRPRPGFLVMADVDDFKGLNDRFGHAAGDAALRTLGHACRDEVAGVGGGVAARLGGDEFVLLLPESDTVTPEDTAAAISRRLTDVQRLDGLPLPTVSYGVAELDLSAGLEVTLGRADAALYRAKAGGTGLVERAPSRDDQDAGGMRDAS
jgi:diguanylate cyclase (GGDEF)-like protein